MGTGRAQTQAIGMGLREERAWLMTTQFLPPGISNIAALSSLVRPGTPGWPFTCLLTGAQRHPKPEAVEAR